MFIAKVCGTNIICYLLPRGPDSNAPLFYAALQQAQIQPTTSRHETGVGGWCSWPDVRGKYTARVHDSDMNTVDLAGLCVRTHFPLRPLGEPGARPSQGVSCDVSVSLRQNSSSRNVANLYSGRAAGD